MADSSTPRHDFILPEVGSSQDSWGDKLNSNWSDIDSLLPILNVFSMGAISALGTIRHARGELYTVNRFSAGEYEVTWDNPQPDTAYVVMVTPAQSSGGNGLSVEVPFSLVLTGSFTYRTAGTVYINTDVSFICTRL